MRFSLATSCVAAIPLLLGAAEPSYYRDVRPILNRSCTTCHQPAVKSSGLDLTTYAGFQAGGTRGAAFAAASPEESLVVKFITGAMKPSMPLWGPRFPARISKPFAAGSNPAPKTIPRSKSLPPSPPFIISLR